jgi:uncharacterized protein YndB with AHSA1/START domain
MTQAATKIGTHDIVVDEVFPHAPETIWKALTSGALMERWLGMKTVGYAPVKGTRFTYQTKPAGEWDGLIRCQVLEVIPSERLTYDWKSGSESNVGYGAPLDTVVTFTLSRVAGGTRLRLVHSGFLRPQNEIAFKNMGEGWKTVVGRIVTVATEQD